MDEFVDFVDSRGLFSCRIPTTFLRKERKKDKQGTLFVAADYKKAEVLSVQSVAAFDLLADAGERDVQIKVQQCVCLEAECWFSVLPLVLMSIMGDFV